MRKPSIASVHSVSWLRGFAIAATLILGAPLAWSDGVKTSSTSFRPAVKCKISQLTSGKWEEVTVFDLAGTDNDAKVTVPLTGAFEIKPNGAELTTPRKSKLSGYPSPPAQVVDAFGSGGHATYQVTLSVDRSVNSSNGNDQVNVMASASPNSSSNSTDFVQLYDNKRGGGCATSGGLAAVSGDYKVTLEDDTTPNKKTKTGLSCVGAMLPGAPVLFFTETKDFYWKNSDDSEEIKYVYGLPAKQLRAQAFQFKADCTLTRNPERDNPANRSAPSGSGSGADSMKSHGAGI